eukprot:SAG22_NODE_495_length_9802_cov_111.077605_7_plen_74_part_00
MILPPDRLTVAACRFFHFIVSLFSLSLARSLSQDEDVYEMPPMKVSVLVRTFPEISVVWERLGVEIYQVGAGA